MDQPIEAIYENGVLRPLEPLSLPDQARVKVTVESAEPQNGAGAEGGAAADSDQQLAWREAFHKIEADPQAKEHADGWSAANADDVLYGRPDGPA